MTLGRFSHIASFADVHEHIQVGILPCAGLFIICVIKNMVLLFIIFAIRNIFLLFIIFVIKFLDLWHFIIFVISKIFNSYLLSLLWNYSILG